MECVMFCVADFEKHAEKTLSQTNLGFYKTGSYDDNTIQWNREAFHRLALWAITHNNNGHGWF